MYSCKDHHSLNYSTLGCPCCLFVDQKSLFAWTNRTLSQHQVAMMESQSDLSSLGPPAAECPSMNLHSTNRRKPLRTKDAGTLQPNHLWCSFRSEAWWLISIWRYTLTEGDFHHLKKARLTHLHLPPAQCDLKILTIMECESTESSSTNINESGASKLPLTIYQVAEHPEKEHGWCLQEFKPELIFSLNQPGERRVCDWMGQSVSGGLPGDPHHSIILDQGGRKSSSAMKPQHTHSQTVSFTLIST